MKVCIVCRKTPVSGKNIALTKYCDKCRNTVLNKQKRNWDDKNRLIDSETLRYYRIKYKYKLSREQYNRMLARQKQCCAACGKPFALTNPSDIHVDHCHASGAIRGMLCGACNRCLGLMRDSADNLIKLARYIRKFQ